MPHEIEQFSDGSAAYVGARETAWHRLGTTLPEEFSAEQAMEAAYLGNWNVRKVPLKAQVAPDTELEVPGQFASVRDNPDPAKDGQIDVLGIVGDWWEPIQNESHCQLLNDLAHSVDAKFSTAGSLLGGKEVFVTMKMPGHLEVGGRDRVDLYIAALNSHDGTGAFHFLLTPVRIVCKNTQTYALRHAEQKFAIRHSGKISTKLEVARQSMQLALKSADAFEAEAGKMLDAALTEQQFVKIIRRIYPINLGSPRERKAGSEKPTARAKEQYESRLDTMRTIWNGATNAEIAGTRWAAYQTVMEWIDFRMPVRSDDDASQTDRVRAQRTLLHPQTLRAKEKAFAAFSVR